MQNFPLPLDIKNAAMQEAVFNSRKELTDLLKRQRGSQVMLGAAVTTGGTGVPVPLVARVYQACFKAHFSHMAGKEAGMFPEACVTLLLGYWLYKSKST